MARRKPPQPAYPRQIEVRYRAALLAMVRDLEAEIRDKLIDRLPQIKAERDLLAPRTDAWDETIEEVIRALSVFGERRAQRVIDSLSERATSIESWSRRDFTRVIQQAVGVDILGRGVDRQWLASEMRSWARENATLIQSIPEQMLTQVEGIVQRGVRGGLNPSDVAKEIRGRFGVTESRAKLIARDQVAKLNADITKSRQEALGIDTYFWQTSGDERVRDSHRVLDGMLCRWDDPSVYSDDGGQTWQSKSSIGGYDGHVGTDVNCRCVSIPNLDPILEGS